MKKLIALTLFSTLLISYAQSQYQDRYWVLGRAKSGNNANISFDFYPSGLSLYNTLDVPPSMTPPPNNISNSNGFEGWGVVTDPVTGELLFYTDGNSVFDSNHQDITPGGGLGASPSSSQAVVIAVAPTCPFDQYYIFSNPTGVWGGGNTSGPVTYRTYTLDGGFSGINALPGPNGNLSVGEGMVIVPSKTNPFTYWLIIRLLHPTANGSDYVVYKIDETGISFHATYNFGPPITSNPYSPIMNMTYVDDGSIDDVIVGFTASGAPNLVFTNVFNTSTGAFTGGSNLIASFSSGTLYDLEFSPDGNYIYYATYFPSVLYQVGIDGGSPVNMNYFGSLRGGGLKKAPDGFIYHIYDAGDNNGSSTVRMGRIIEPETAFNGSNFNEMYQADFNAGLSMVYSNVFAYNFPEFVNIPAWEIELVAISDPVFCEGGSTLLTAEINALGQAIESYNWSLNGSFLTSTDNPSLEVVEEGDYQVEVVMEGGCNILSNEVVIEMISTNLPQIDNVITMDAECGSATGSIIVEASGGTGQILFSLDNGTYQAGNTFSDLSTGFYQLTIQDDNGCVDVQDIEISQIGEVPSIIMVNSTGTSCTLDDGIIELNAVGGTGELSYSIDEVNFQLDSIFLGLVPGAYNVVVMDEAGCIVSQGIEVEAPTMPAIQSIVINNASCNTDDGSFIVEANGGTGELMFSLDSFNFQSENIFTALFSGEYTLYIEDEAGCSIDTIITLTEGQCPIYIPNAFSPNDDGINDLFQVYSNGNPGIKVKSYTIFDRWGELIYEAKDFHPVEISMYWNGTFKGEKMGLGIYVYLIEIVYEDGNIEVAKGDVTLVR